MSQTDRDDNGSTEQEPAVRVEFKAVLEYDSEERVPANPRRAMRRLVQEEAGFGDVTVERRGE